MNTKTRKLEISKFIIISILNCLLCSVNFYFFIFVNNDVQFIVIATLEKVFKSCNSDNKW